jgi:hypothetical protein
MTGRDEQHRKAREDREHAEREETERDEGRRVVDESVPTPEGLTSPDETVDDAPAEPRQSKDYA